MNVLVLFPKIFESFVFKKGCDWIIFLQVPGLSSCMVNINFIKEQETSPIGYNLFYTCYSASLCKALQFIIKIMQEF